MPCAFRVVVEWRYPSVNSLIIVDCFTPLRPRLEGSHLHEILEHSSMTITLDRYSHVIPAMHREAAQTMDSLLGSPYLEPEATKITPEEERNGAWGQGRVDSRSEIHGSSASALGGRTRRPVIQLVIHGTRISNRRIDY